MGPFWLSKPPWSECGVCPALHHDLNHAASDKLISWNSPGQIKRVNLPFSSNSHIWSTLTYVQFKSILIPLYRIPTFLPILMANLPFGQYSHTNHQSATPISDLDSQIDFPAPIHRANLYLITFPLKIDFVFGSYSSLLCSIMRTCLKVGYPQMHWLDPSMNLGGIIGIIHENPLSSPSFSRLIPPQITIFGGFYCATISMSTPCCPCSLHQASQQWLLHSHQGPLQGLTENVGQALAGLQGPCAVEQLVGLGVTGHGASLEVGWTSPGTYNSSEESDDKPPDFWGTLNILECFMHGQAATGFAVIWMFMYSKKYIMDQWIGQK